jgi:membrane protein implicated in regulation of membrane protease activity
MNPSGTFRTLELSPGYYYFFGGGWGLLTSLVFSVVFCEPLFVFTLLFFIFLILLIILVWYLQTFLKLTATANEQDNTG